MLKEAISGMTPEFLFEKSRLRTLNPQGCKDQTRFLIEQYPAIGRFFLGAAEELGPSFFNGAMMHFWFIWQFYLDRNGFADLLAVKETTLGVRLESILSRPTCYLGPAWNAISNLNPHLKTLLEVQAKENSFGSDFVLGCISAYEVLRIKDFEDGSTREEVSEICRSAHD